MLKQWLVNDGRTDSISVEEKFVRWVEQLRTDKYVAVSCMQKIHYRQHTCLVYASMLNYKAQVTKLQLYKIYGKSKEAKTFVEEITKGNWIALTMQYEHIDFFHDKC